VNVSQWTRFVVAQVVGRPLSKRGCQEDRALDPVLTSSKHHASITDPETRSLSLNT
jgi:hypothetical protein